MIRTLVFLAGLLAAANSAGAVVKIGPVGSFVHSRGPTIPVPGVDLDFTTSAAGLTVTRAGTAYIDNLAGTWTSVAANTARQSDKGLLIEEARTNVVLQNRDLTQAAWVKTSTTAAKDQTGVDGAANSASSLTATGANGTALQTTSIASSARWQSAWVKRITGSGTVQMTMDNGTTWTTVTVTAGWTRVEIPAQTLANPVVGFRLVTSGDKIAVDMVQNENGTWATSPIPTTAAAVTRNADVIKLTTLPSPLGPDITMAVAGTALAPNSAGAQTVLEISDGSSTNRWATLRQSGSGQPVWILNAGSQIQFGSNWAPNAAGKTASGHTSGSQGGSFNGAAVTLGAVAATLSGLNIVAIGSNFSGATVFSSYLTRLRIWPTTRLTDAQLQQASQ